MSSTDPADEVTALRRHLADLDRERLDVLAAIERAEAAVKTRRDATAIDNERVGHGLSSDAKIALFRSLFRGREDVFPRRWVNPKTGKSGYSPVCRNEWVQGVCEKPRVKCTDCPNRAFVRLDDEIFRCHLQGRGLERKNGSPLIAGIYPLLPDETCWLLAADFDKLTWQRDSAAFIAACRDKGVPAALERSRSGDGAHVWILFSEPVPASDARKLGTWLITETMDRCPDIGFQSYDRFFPSQDTMPSGGFGNLIALPLQHGPRQNGNSVFVEDDLQPHRDQWAYLAGLSRMTRAEVIGLVEDATRSGRLLRVRLPIDDDDEEPWLAPPSRKRVEQPTLGNVPDSVEVVVSNQVFIDRTALPPLLVARLVRLAAFQNPEFYAAQAMRLSTFGKPRVISCAELFAKHIGLPRGCLDAALAVLTSVGSQPRLRDERCDGIPLQTRFLGTLNPEQQRAGAALLDHEIGVLAAGTAFGKTVVAANLIAARGRNTLILVHRQQLMDQWVARLGTFLDLDPKRIGIIGGGKKRPGGLVDVAIIQSLSRKGEVADLVADYGHIIVDECHHLSAVSFEAIARAAKARFVLGLSATVTRKDGHHPIIFMQCGPIRFRVDAKKQAAARPFVHRVILRRTGFRISGVAPEGPGSIPQVYNLLAQAKDRNDMIVADVLTAVAEGRSPVVITERKDHLDTLAEHLSTKVRNVIVLAGGMGKRKLTRSMAALEAVPAHEERVIVATGRYLGEGFDDARLDDLFLTMPISWRGTLAQYAGRLHRLHAAKREVRIHDYVDEDVLVLARMAARRRAGYSAIGYCITEGGDLFAPARQDPSPPSKTHLEPDRRSYATQSGGGALTQGPTGHRR